MLLARAVMLGNSGAVQEISPPPLGLEPGRGTGYQRPHPHATTPPDLYPPVAPRRNGRVGRRYAGPIAPQSRARLARVACDACARPMHRGGGGLAKRRLGV